MGYNLHVAPIENRYAHVWHDLRLAEDFRDGKPHSVKATLKRFRATAKIALAENSAG